MNKPPSNLIEHKIMFESTIAGKNHDLLETGSDT